MPAALARSLTGARASTALAAAVSAALYALFYFVLLELPPIGVALFRIDYVMTTVERGNDMGDVWFALYSARPVSQSLIMLQSAAGRLLLGGEVRYIAYALQHLAVLAYFFMVAHVLAHVFRQRLHWLATVAAWVLFLQCQGVLDGVYKLESIVGTASMLLGGLSLMALVRWDKVRTHRWAAGAVVLYALSVFAKEDFLLPPVLLLGWFAWRDGASASLPRLLPWAISMGAVLVAFIVFNRVILPGHSFIESIPDPTSPYHISTSPTDMLRVFWSYAWACGDQVRFVGIAWAAATALALLLRLRCREALWIGVVVGGLMGPYLILPNHQFPLYALKWLPWQTLGALSWLQCLSVKRTGRAFLATAASLALAGLVTANTLVEMDAHREPMWHQARYLHTHYGNAARLQASLREQRDALNRLAEVAVLGVGSGPMLLSPWHNQGETDFWFGADMGLRPRWHVYVQQPGDGYEVGSRGVGHVMDVRPLEAFVKDRPSHAFVVHRDGTGALVDLRGQDPAEFIGIFELRQPMYWTANASMRVSMAPERLRNCVGGRGIVRVDWDLSAPDPAVVVDAWVKQDGKRVLWARGPAKSGARTGAWVKPGMEVELVRHDTQALLARTIVGEAPCL